MSPTRLMLPHGVSSQWPFSHSFASPTSLWPRSRALALLVTSVALTESFRHMAQFFALSGLKILQHRDHLLFVPLRSIPGSPLCPVSVIMQYFPWFLLQPPLPSSESCVTEPWVPWLTPSSPTQWSPSYPRLVYAPFTTLSVFSLNPITMSDHGLVYRVFFLFFILS